MENNALLFVEDTDECLFQPEIGRLYWVRCQDTRLLAVMTARGKWVSLIEGTELSDTTEFEVA